MGIHERKEREKESRREAIIDAAEKVFFKKGFTTATMDEVAELAELSKGTLYLYYKSKEDLMLALHLRGEEIMYQMFVKATTTGEPTLQLLSNLGEAYYEFFKTHRDYFRTFQFLNNPQFHKEASKEMLEVCHQHGMKIWDLVAGVVKQAIDEKLFEADIDPMQAAIILWSNGNGLMQQMEIGGQYHGRDYWLDLMHVDLEDTMRKAYQYIIEGMMRHDLKDKVKELVTFSRIRR